MVFELKMQRAFYYIKSLWFLMHICMHIFLFQDDKRIELQQNVNLRRLKQFEKE